MSGGLPQRRESILLCEIIDRSSKAFIRSERECDPMTESIQKVVRS
jgi:hypothetical protein